MLLETLAIVMKVKVYELKYIVNLLEEKKNKGPWDISYIKALRRMIIPIYKSEGSKRVN